MVAQVLANALELVANLDADAFEQFRLADAGQADASSRASRATGWSSATEAWPAKTAPLAFRTGKV
jgi:hypothetical protein